MRGTFTRSDLISAFMYSDVSDPSPSGSGSRPESGSGWWVSRCVCGRLSLTGRASSRTGLWFVPAERAQTPAADERPPPESWTGPKSPAGTRERKI